MSPEVDPANTDPRYWEKILKEEGLSMARGKGLSHSGSGPRHRGGRGRRNARPQAENLIQAGDAHDIEALQTARPVGGAYIARERQQELVEEV